MAAIEYGSYYWCVLLNADPGGQSNESIHLHADSISIEDGSLIFKSAGRRPVGTDPKETAADSGAKNADGKSGQGDQEMIYVAFGPGSWKLVYAAKLQDGSPAAVEHWKKSQNGALQLDEANAGASGYVSQGVV